MMKKRVFSILLAFVMALCLLPAQKAKADGTSEKACSFCGQALSVHASVSKHYYRCRNSACSNYYDGSDSSKQISEEHSLDGDCKCSVCGWYIHATTIINDGVHKAPTCTEPGVDIDGQCWYCVNCKKYFSLVYCEYPSPETGTYTPALGHDWATTLTNGGSTHYYACSRCDAKKDEAAHNYVWSYVDDDTHKGVCACGAEITVEHVWNGSHWCGYPRKCKDCGEYYGEVLDHEYWYEYKTDEQHKINCYHCDGLFGREDHSGGTATCIAKAVCEKCKAEYGEYAAHKGGTATCTEKAVCEICGQEYGDPLDHDWATAWTQGDTTHYYACSRCTERKDEAPHSYSWTYVDDNTCKGECTCGATTTEAHYDRWASFCDYQPHCEKCDHDYGPRNEHSMYYVDKGESGHKPYCYNCDAYFFVESHSGGEATCTSKAKCEKCGADYGDLAEHTGGKATCTEKAKCTVCGQPYGDVDPNNHDLINHEAKAPTCTEIGWDAYDTCSRCDYTTYVEKKALDHDLVHHDAQAPTCTEIGWDAYDTCSRGDYTTYVEKKALDHDLVHHDAQAPTCTEIGWSAYDTCSRCDYTTYKKIAALGHTEVVDEAIAPTCTETGLTEGNHCSVCGEILTVQASIPALGHRYGLWEHAESGKHQARCTRCGAVAKVDCAHIALPQTDPDAEPITLCPICGHRDNADDLVRVTDTKAKGAYGNLVVFITGEDEPNRFLTVAFEWNGRLVQPRNTVTVTLPAELLDSCDLLLIASDGTETQLVPEITGDLTTFTLDFVVENERLLARLLRMQQKA